MNFFPCQNLSRKHYSLQESSNEFFSLQESFKETVFLARIFQGNSIPCKNLTRKFIPCKILARCLAEKCIILQDLERKSCKILARNAFFFNQGAILMQNDTSDVINDKLAPSSAWYLKIGDNVR